MISIYNISICSSWELLLSGINTTLHLVCPTSSTQHNSFFITSVNTLEMFLQQCSVWVSVLSLPGDDDVSVKLLIKTSSALVTTADTHNSLSLIFVVVSYNTDWKILFAIPKIFADNRFPSAKFGAWMVFHWGHRHHSAFFVPQNLVAELKSWFNYLGWSWH